MNEASPHPRGWSLVKLSALIRELASGVSVNGEDRPASEDEIGVLKVSAVSEGRIFPNENKAVKISDVSRVRMPVCKGDLIVSRANTAELIGACGQARDDYPHLYLPDKLWKVVLRHPFDDSIEWLLHVLNSPSMRQALKDRATGTSGSMKNIPQESFLAIPVLRPLLSEKKKIAAILSTADRAIELTEDLSAAKRKRKVALIQQLLTGTARLPGFARNQWERIPLDDLGSFSKGFGFSKSDMAPSGHQAVRYGELYTVHDTVIRHIASFIDDRVAAASRKIAHGDILFPCSGETADEIGKPSVYLGDNHAFAGGDIIIFTPRRGDPLFLAYALNAPDAIRYRASHGKGQSVVHIYAVDLKGYQCPFPPVEEQQAIAAVLNTQDREIAVLQRKLDALRRQKKGLMQQLLTGRVRVRVEPDGNVPVERGRAGVS